MMAQPILYVVKTEWGNKEGAAGTYFAREPDSETFKRVNDKLFFENYRIHTILQHAEKGYAPDYTFFLVKYPDECEGCGEPAE